MCCFSRVVEHVSKTRIFARSHPDGSQLLVYQMDFRAAGDLAMILPLPVPARSPEDALEFVDLSHYPTFFAELARAFPQPISRAAKGGFPPQSIPWPATLAVHEVGDFDASFVPTLADFERLDPRFRLPPQTWDALPDYLDWGFAVFALRDSRPRSLRDRLLPRKRARDRSVHPMAFRFPRRDPAQLFFPTVHVHDGVAHPSADFDHSLYAQLASDAASNCEWERAEADALSRNLDPAKAAAIVDLTAPCFRSELRGHFDNTDITLAA